MTLQLFGWIVLASTIGCFLAIFFLVFIFALMSTAAGNDAGETEYGD